MREVSSKTGYAMRRRGKAGRDQHSQEPRESPHSRSLREAQERRLWNVFSAAAIVASMSAGEWAADTNPASNADGAKYTPSSSMRWKKRLKRSTSQAITFAKLSTLALLGEEKAEHAAHVIGGERDAGARGRDGEPLHEDIGGRIQPLVEAGCRDELQGGEAGRHGDRDCPIKCPAW